MKPDLDLRTVVSGDASPLHDLVQRVLDAGATDAEAAFSCCDRGLMIDVRDGALQGARSVETAGLRVSAYVGKRKATTTMASLRLESSSDLVERLVYNARSAPEDAFCGLAPAAWVSTGSEQELDLFDPCEQSPEQLLDLALDMEAAARAVASVTKTDSAQVGWNVGLHAHAASNGLSHLKRESSTFCSISVMAGEGDTKELGYAGRWAHWREDLVSPREVGAEAGIHATSRLGSRKLESRRAAVIFDHKVSMSFLDPMLNAIRGSNIARGESFLKNALGERIFPRAFQMIDDPFVRRGLGSRACDFEGVAAQRRLLIDDGVLTTWLLDCAASRQLNLRSTGHAGGTYNLSVTPGAQSQADLMRDAGEGLLVTTFFSPSLNPNSGDWSAGVAGFWFERGEIAFPVSEVTVAGCLPALYQEIVAGSDLEIRSAANAPSLLVPSMSIGGC